MKIILLQDIEKLGKRYDVKNVADGYARNFLLPKNMAVLATKTELEKVNQIKEEEAKVAEEELVRYQELASQIDGLEFEIAAKVSEEGKLFGAISDVKIAEFLQIKGFDIKKEQIKLENPIKELGDYEINIEFPHNLEAKIKLIVVAEKENE